MTTTASTSSSASASSKSGSGSSAAFDIHAAYLSHLATSADLPMPIAAIFALCDLLSSSNVGTTTELTALLRRASDDLKAALPNPVPATAGLDLFARLVSAMAWGDRDFEAMKADLISLAREYAEKTVPACRQVIARRAMPFIKDDAVIFTHSYSRVVMRILLDAARQGKRPSVYVTEARPSGLGLKTHSELLAAGIPSTVLCDSAAAYAMRKADLVLVGAEGVCESGGLLSVVGTLQLAIIAKSTGTPFYAAAESFKFLRVFPLGQEDLPTARPVLPFPIDPSSEPAAKTQGAGRMTEDMEALNPLIDYTPPEYIAGILSDVGVLATSSGVGDALLAVYGGAD